MRSQEELIRRVYSPLNISVGLEILTPNSPATQIFNEALNQVEPSRRISPCVICPSINAWADDGSWETGESNMYLTNMKWLVAGTDKKTWTDISTLNDWNSSDASNPYYSIDTSNSFTRGAITIYKDLAANTNIALKFTAILYDKRLDSSHSIETDEIILQTINKGEDKYGICITEATNILYNPVLDKLLQYNYKVAHGLISASDTERKKCFDGNQYERTINVEVFKGKNKADQNNYTLQVWKSGDTSALVPGATELMSIDKTSIKLDLRIIGNQGYIIKLLVDNKLALTMMFSVARVNSDFIVRPMNGTSIEYGDVNRYHKILVHESNGGQKVECPEHLLKMVWITEATNSSIGGDLVTTKTWNEGDETIFPINDVGLGENDHDLMKVYVEYDQKKEYKFASENNNYLTDENGNYLIIN